MQDLKHRLELKSREHDRVMKFLTRLQGGTDYDAVGVFARIRLGEPIDGIMQR